MENEYKYFAFVSYRSSDEKWAKWVQEKIEAYRLPTTIVKTSKANLPKTKLRPCFRYHTDIQPNELKVELHNKLEQSKYLLVICTPRSAQSPWVGNEIETFIELGRRDRIIPIIVEGVPYSGDPATECFNPVIHKFFPHSDNIADDREILGVNINEEGSGSKWMKRERAIIQIVSRMLDVNYDQLWNRQRRRIIERAIIATLSTILVICAVAATWILNQPFDSKISLNEVSVQNENLPAMHDAVVTLRMENEEKIDTFATIDGQVIFCNIPARMKHKTAQLLVVAPDFIAVDTVVTLDEQIELNMCRDERIYGHIAVPVMLDGDFLRNVQLKLNEKTVATDAEGRIEIDIPLGEQRSEYQLTTTDGKHTAILYAPCGPNDVVILE